MPPDDFFAAPERLVVPPDLLEPRERLLALAFGLDRELLPPLRLLDDLLRELPDDLRLELVPLRELAELLRDELRRRPLCAR